MLVGASILSYLLSQDIILAALFALLALPGVILQPWSIPLLLWSKGLLFSPIITTGITLLIYWRFQHASWIKKIAALFQKLSFKKLGLGLFVLLSGISVVSLSRFKDIPALKTGIPRQSSYVLNSSLPDLIRQRGKFYQLPSFLDKEGLWQVKVSENEWKQVIKQLSLDSIAQKDVPSEFNDMPPYWWQPSFQASTQVYSTPNFPGKERGSDGFHAIALWNADDQLLYLWFKDNF